MKSFAKYAFILCALFALPGICAAATARCAPLEGSTLQPATKAECNNISTLVTLTKRNAQLMSAHKTFALISYYSDHRDGLPAATIKRIDDTINTSSAQYNALMVVLNSLDQEADRTTWGRNIQKAITLTHQLHGTIKTCLYLITKAYPAADLPTS